MIFGYPYHQIIEFSVQPILTLCSSTARHLHIGDPEGYWDKMKKLLKQPDKTNNIFEHFSTHQE